MGKYLISSLLLLATALAVHAEDNAAFFLKAFPPAGEGQKRIVIKLPHKESDESKDFQIEVLVGKEVITDGINHYSIEGKIASKEIEGWGVRSYHVPDVDKVMSTLIGVLGEPPPKVTKFVAMEPLILPYNSRLPIVIYVPKDAEVRYRIWKAGDTVEKAKEG
jgi:ecotin